MIGLSRDTTLPVRTVFFLMLLFGSFQLLFMFEIFYTRPFVQNSPQCDCKCTKQLHISAGTNSKVEHLSLQGKLEEGKSEVGMEMDQSRKAWQKMEEVEEAKLDKKLLKAKNLNTSEDGEPDENIHGEKEKLEGGHLQFNQAKLEIPMHTNLKLNPEINEQQVRCSGDYSNMILIYVYSAPGNFRERRRVRRTWGSVKDIGQGKQLRVIFFIGGLDKSKRKLYTTKLKDESESYGDIVQDMSYIDSYRNLTMKGMSAMKWVTKYCPSPYRVVKVDDDTLVNPFALAKFLSGQTQANMKKMICKVTSYARPFRNPASKYYVSKTEYRKDVYPPYCQGYGYILPPQMIPTLIEHFKNVKPIAMEDVYFTGLVRSAAKQKNHALTALFSTVFSNFDKFLERIVARPELMLIGHVHTERFADIYWKLIRERYGPDKDPSI